MRLHPNYASDGLRMYSLRLLATTISLIAVTGCSDEATDPLDVPGGITGNYVLADVGGNRVPATIYEGPWTLNGQRINVRITVRGSTLQLGSGARYTLLIQLEATTQGQTAPVPITDEGEYRRSGDRIDFLSDDAEIGSFSGTVRSTGITVPIDLVGDGHPPVFTFRK